ncbi:MAG: methyl-accepting chemotaxis protein [Cyanobacteriota bacterium]
MNIESFIPKNFNNEKELFHKTKIALYTNLLTLIAGIIFSLLYFLVGNKLGSILIFLMPIFLLINFKILQKTESITLFSNLVCLGAFYAIDCAILTSGGVENGLAFCWSFALSILAFVLMQNKSAWIWIFISIINYFTIFFINRNYFIIPNYVMGEYSSYMNLATILGSFLIMGAFAQIFQSGINNSREELKNEKELVDMKVHEAIEEIENKNLEILITNEKIEEQNKNLELKNKDLEESLKSTEKTQNDLNLEKEKLKENQLYLENSINNILDKMNLFSDGDLTVKINSTNNDYIGKLYDGFSDSVLKMKNTIENVIVTIKEANKLSNTIQEMNSFLVENIEKQTNEIESVSSSAEELSVIAEQNSKTSYDTMQNCNKNKEIAEKSSEIVSKSINNIKEIGNFTKNSTNKINELEISIKKISEIISVINDISDQTNLLALNASIEAARAGDAGRGFSVVAQEIRNLSEKTLISTKEINLITNLIQSQSKESVLIMKDVNKKVNEEISFSSKVSDSLDNIIDSSNQLLFMATQISSSAEQQSLTSNDITKSLYQIGELFLSSHSSLADIFDVNNKMMELMNNLKIKSETFIIK